MGDFLQTEPALDWRAVAAVIDHTLLAPDTAAGEIEQLCREAAHFGFAAVAIQPGWVALAASLLHDTPVRVCAAIGFPHGATTTSVKRFEAAEALRLGADELDMVMNIGALKSGDRERVQADIAGVAEVTRAGGGILKVILETSLLTNEEKTVACQIAVAAGADFVKTSTGYADGGATVEDVALMRKVVGTRAGVKASGGIRSAAQVAALLRAGADRIGSSASVGIMGELGAR